MKTIAGRAKDAWASYEYREGCLYHTTFEDGYIQGAIEQKAIDAAEHTEEMRKLNEEWKENLVIQRAMLIDKAWEFIEITIIREGHASEDFVEEMNWRFKKAMEEEQ